MADLVPCPLCGEKPYFILRPDEANPDQDWYIVKCPCNHVTGGAFASKDKATKAWNKSMTIKPCPFCGEKARIRKKGEMDGGGGYSLMMFVECDSCECKSSASRYMSVAIAAWNRRHSK